MNNRAAAMKRIIAATEALVIGKTYFLSSFYDKDGCWVKVLSKSTKLNRCGWPSSVEIEVLEPVGDDKGKPYYAPGTKHSCNATNLYEKQEMAAHKVKYKNL